MATFAVGPTHRRGAHTAPVLSRTGTDITLLDPEQIDIDQHVISLGALLGVGLRARRAAQQPPQGLRR